MNEKPSSLDIKQNIENLRNDMCVKKKGSSTRYIGLVCAISCDLLAGLFVGAAIGYFLYKYFVWHVAVVGLFVLLGGLAGLLNMYNTLKRFEKDNIDA